MATVIDSNKTQLEPAQIMMEFAANYNSTEYPTEVVTVALMKEITMPDVDLVQFGNTAFIGHRGKGENENLMWGRGLTVDTAQNFITAGLKYFNHLQELGIERYVTDYDGDIYDSAFKTWKRYTDKGDSKIAVGRKASGDSRAYVTLGEIPLSEIM
tara:strand:+ start:47 stop:514 length:468 start_codon:yes stop_codon:yes gene_type:complete